MILQFQKASHEIHKSNFTKPVWCNRKYKLNSLYGNKNWIAVHSKDLASIVMKRNIINYIIYLVRKQHILSHSCRSCKLSKAVPSTLDKHWNLCASYCCNHNTKYSVVALKRSQFPQTIHKRYPHSSPVRVSYGVFFVGTAFDWYSF